MEFGWGVSNLRKCYCNIGILTGKSLHDIVVKERKLLNQEK